MAQAVGSVSPTHAASPIRRRAGLLTLLRHPRAFWHFLTDRDAPLLPRILGVLSIAYVVLPIDAIPDVIPIFGWLDDLGVITLTLGFVASRAMRYVDAHPKLLESKNTPETATLG